MAVPTNKDELLKAIVASYNRLKTELLAIPEELTTLPELEGHSKGTFMSINHLLSYLIGWGELVLKWNQKKDNNEPVDFPDTGYKWNELGKLAQKFYEDYKDDSFNTLNQKLNNTVERILLLIESKSDKELYELSWYGKWTRGRMIQFNTSSPYANARARIRKWQKGRSI